MCCLGCVFFGKKLVGECGGKRGGAEKPDGSSGRFALIFRSATAAASASIFDASSLTLLKFRDMPELAPQSNIKPLSMLLMSPSSFSASGITPVSPLLTERRTLIAGPSVVMMSPSSVHVCRRSSTWSSASFEFMTRRSILRTSASSLA